MSFNPAAFTQQAEKVLEHIRQDIGSLRTGRASIQLLDPVTVEAYGSRMKLVELASISAPDATMLVVSPWDKSLLEAIARGITVADLNVNPVVDGSIIRISIPSLTEDVRKEMVKRLHQKIESGRVMFRNLRAETKQALEDQKGEAGVSEDDIEQDIAELEKALKTFLDQLDELAQHKEKELLTV
jgi:ribosome recycling factor